MVDTSWVSKLHTARILTIPLLREGESLPSAVLTTVAQGDFPVLADHYPSFLNVHEKGFFDSIRSAGRRTDYLLSRFAAKHGLGEYLREADPTKIEVATGVVQQAVVRYPSSHVPDVSLTHTRSHAGALVFPKVHPMAIDFEMADPDKLEQFRSNCLPREIKLAAPLVREEPLRWTLIWTIKEALSKILKSGLSCPFDIFEIENLRSNDGAFDGDYKNFAPYRFYGWHVNGMMAAMVLPRKTELGIGPAEIGRFLNETSAVGA